MAKERKTADQLSDMIVSAMGIGEVVLITSSSMRGRTIRP